VLNVRDLILGKSFTCTACSLTMGLAVPVEPNPQNK
jgi:hypothetical protein